MSHTFPQICVRCGSCATIPEVEMSKACVSLVDNTAKGTKLTSTDKRAWVVKSATLWAKKFHVPFAGPPDGFLESSTTQLQQALCVVSVRHPEQLPDLIEVLEEAFWVGRKQLFSRDVFQPVFEQVLGAEKGREVVESVSSPYFQPQLRN